MIPDVDSKIPNWSDGAKAQLQSKEHCDLLDIINKLQRQLDEDAEMVKSLVLSYMWSPRSIILAVVSAKSDVALQSVTQHAQRLDHEVICTLGLTTKPDTLNEGSDSEHTYMELAQNNNIKFRLDWHILHNWDFSSRAVSTAE